MEHQNDNKLINKTMLITDAFITIILFVIAGILYYFKFLNYTIVALFFATVSLIVFFKSLSVYTSAEDSSKYSSNKMQSKDILESLSPHIMDKISLHGFIANHIDDFTPFEAIGIFKGEKIYSFIKDKNGVKYIFERVISHMDKLQNFKTHSSSEEILMYPGIVYKKHIQ